MMNCNTEDDTTAVFKNSVWNIEFLLNEYTNDYIPSILNQGWAIDEMNEGFPVEDLIQELWNSYEGWAERKFLKSNEVYNERNHTKHNL